MVMKMADVNYLSTAYLNVMNLNNLVVKSRNIDLVWKEKIIPTAQRNAAILKHSYEVFHETLKGKETYYHVIND